MRRREDGEKQGERGWWECGRREKDEMLRGWEGGGAGVERQLQVTGRGSYGTEANDLSKFPRFFLSPIGARTLKMPVPYSRPNVEHRTLYPDSFCVCE